MNDDTRSKPTAGPHTTCADGIRDDDVDEIESDRRMFNLLRLLFLDLEPEEEALTDRQRLEYAMERCATEPATRSIRGDVMSWGLYCLSRPGLSARLADAVRCVEAPPWILPEAESWSDDELRAWLAEHDIRTTREAFAELEKRKRRQRAAIRRGARHVLVVGTVAAADVVKEIVAAVNTGRSGPAFKVHHLAARDRFATLPPAVRSALACIVLDTRKNSFEEADVDAPPEVPRVAWFGRRPPDDQLRAVLLVGRRPGRSS